MVILEDGEAEEGVVNLLLLTFLVEGNLDGALTRVDRMEGPHDAEELRIQAQDVRGRLEGLQERVAPLIHIQVVVGVTTTHNQRQRQQDGLLIVHLVVQVRLIVVENLTHAVHTHKSLGVVIDLETLVLQAEALSRHEPLPLVGLELLEVLVNVEHIGVNVPI